MAKAIIVKCKYCNKDIDRDSAYKHSERNYYCNKECFDNKQREKKGEGSSSKIKYKPQKGTNRREFTDTVQNLFIQAGWDKRNINWAMITSQASNILKDHEVWSYDTLTYILWYMSEILELQLINKESNYSPLSLIEYYAKEAEEYCVQNQLLEDSINEFNFNDNKIFIKKTNNKINKLKPIDITLI